MYEHYESQCEVETEGGQKQKGPWQRLPSYNRLLKYATGKVFVSLLVFEQIYYVLCFISLRCHVSC